MEFNMQQTDKISIYKHLQALDMLYRQSLLGDCYVDLMPTMSISNVQNIQKITHQTTSTNTTHLNMQNDTQRLWWNIAHKVAQCKLCALSKMVRDSHRSCGIIPTHRNNNLHLDGKTFSSNIAFIVESLHFKETEHNEYNSLKILEANRVNDMLFDIIQKVFLLHKESVFIMPFLKCVEVGDNQAINMRIHTQSLATERRICGNYLHAQLECVDYAVFFGEQICHDLFESTLQESNGKLLEYYTQQGKKVVCICVPDIMKMLMNPKLKKDAFVNFVLLRNAMCANSC